jgi:uroporphyrin-3 C-methyltransferase
VSEAELPKTTPELSSAAIGSTPPSHPVARRGNGLAALALLVAAVGVAAGGWSSWQLYHMQEATPAVTEPAVTQAQWEQQRQQSQRGAQQLAERQQAQDTALSELQEQQQVQQQVLQRLQEGGSNELRLNEAEHLLRLASLRLSALQDIGSAIALMQGADDVLREQNDSAAFAVRKQLASSLEQLRSLPQPDRTGLFLKLAALRDQAAQLQALAPSFTLDPEAPEPSADSRWQRWWQQVSSFVRIDFAADQDLRPLLSGQNLAQARLALSLAIEQAQWAVLNGEPQVYAQALQQARDVLEAQFSQNLPQNRALFQRLQALGEEPVTFAMPDMKPALDAFQGYLKQRQTPQPEAPAGEEAESTPEVTP